LNYRNTKLFLDTKNKMDTTFVILPVLFKETVFIGITTYQDNLTSEERDFLRSILAPITIHSECGE